MIVFDKNGRQVELIEKKKSINIGNYFLARANQTNKIEGFYPIEFDDTETKTFNCSMYSSRQSNDSISVTFKIKDKCLYISSEFEIAIQKGECVTIVASYPIVLNAL